MFSYILYLLVLRHISVLCEEPIGKCGKLSFIKGTNRTALNYLTCGSGFYCCGSVLSRRCCKVTYKAEIALGTVSGILLVAGIAFIFYYLKKKKKAKVIPEIKTSEVDDELPEIFGQDKNQKLPQLIKRLSIAVAQNTLQVEDPNRPDPNDEDPDHPIDYRRLSIRSGQGDYFGSTHFTGGHQEQETSLLVPPKLETLSEDDY